MQAKTDGIIGVVNFDNAAEFSQLLTALPQECRVAIAWGTPEATSGITLNRLADRFKIVHMYFADNAKHEEEYAALGKIAPVSSLTWSAYPAVATVTNIANSNQAKIDDFNYEIRYRAPNEPTSSLDDQWITRLGTTVSMIEEKKAIPTAPAITVPVPAATTPLTLVPATTTSLTPVPAPAVVTPVTATTEPAMIPVTPVAVAQAEVPKTPELMPNATPVTATIVPAVQTTKEIPTVTVVTPVTKVEPSTPALIPSTAKTAQEALNQIKEKRNKDSMKYLPWVAGGVILILLLRK